MELVGNIHAVTRPFTLRSGIGENKCRIARNKCRIARNKCRMSEEGRQPLRASLASWLRASSAWVCLQSTSYDVATTLLVDVKSRLPPVIE
jgi:hypothetical protein